MFDDHVVFLGPTPKSEGWMSAAGIASFTLCAPQGIYFMPVHQGWQLPCETLAGLRETLRLTSWWLRREWEPDFTDGQPFGINRRLAVRRTGTVFTLCSPLLPTGKEPCTGVAFNYIELPGLRASIDRLEARQRHLSVTTEGDPHGLEKEVRPD